MATRFKRLRAYFPVRSRASSVCGHSHIACLAMKLATLLLLGYGALAFSAMSARANSFVEFDYNIYNTANRSRGSVFIELFDDRPLTTANFLQYINGSLFNNSLMHRLSFYQGTSTPFVLQGGGFYPSYITEPTDLKTSLNPAAQVDLDGNPATPNPAVASEFHKAPLRSNVKGTIAMFLNSASPNSATNQYFFNLSDNSTYLDFTNGGYTVFARVVGDGMTLIDKYVNELAIINMNPDTNDDGVREAGPFGELPVAVQSVGGVSTFLPLIVTRARAVDYMGSGVLTDVPAGGLTFSNKDVFIDTGANFTGTGAITIGVGRTLGMRENYALNRSLLNHGTVAPGLSLGVIGVNSTYFQYSDGLLAIQLAGTTVDTQYDRLISSSTAFLAGRLHVSTLNNFVPTAGNSFTVLTAQSIVGGFTSFDLPQLIAGLVWNIDQSETAVTLTVVDGADFNKDGIVDARDYVYWRKTNGTPAAYQVWRDNLGNRSGGVFFAGGGSAGGLTIGNIPEPSGGFLALTAGMLLSGLRRRRLRAFRSTPNSATVF